MTAAEQLNLVWWNTGLSPMGKPRKERADFSIAETLISHICLDLQADFIAFGEVASGDVGLIKDVCADFGFTVQSGVVSIGRSSFSTCFATNSDRFQFVPAEHLIVSQEANNFRLGQTGLLSSPDGSTEIRIAICHWPSRLNCPEKAPIRAKLGMRLAEYVSEARVGNAEAKIILMGDFNDEPYDDSLSHHLRATRDRDLIAKKPDLLYNPYWRHLCSEFAPDVDPPPQEQLSWGTYYHRVGDLYRWRTFDQMIFSSSFLFNADWMLNEAKTGVVHYSPYTSLVVKGSTYDHLPIRAVLERRNYV
jgi:hypothetical protein